jgi:hypothetical protein
VPRNRAHGALGQNNSRSIVWAEKQEKFQPKEKCFFLTSTFIEQIRTLLNFARMIICFSKVQSMLEEISLGSVLTVFAIRGGVSFS